MPGRTDNDVKNYWNTKLKKKLSAAVITSNPYVATNNHIQFSTTTSSVPGIKNKNHVNCFTNSIDRSSNDVLSSIEVGSGCNMDSQRLISDLNHFPLLGLMETSGFGDRENNHGVSSSSFPVDGSCISFSGTGYGEDSFLVDMGYGSVHDLLHG